MFGRVWGLLQALDRKGDEWRESHQRNKGVVLCPRCEGDIFTSLTQPTHTSNRFGRQLTKMLVRCDKCGLRTQLVSTNVGESWSAYEPDS